MKISTCFMLPVTRFRLIRTYLPNKLFIYALFILMTSFVNTKSYAQCSATLTPLNIQHPSCGGSDGSFQVNVEGIAAPYGYILYKDVNGAWVKQEEGTLIAGTPTFVFQNAGTYKLAVDKDGICSGETTVVLEHPELTLTPTNIRNPTCGANDGSFQVNVEGMKAPYGYILYKDVSGTWVKEEEGTLIAGNPTFVFLTAGTYKLAVSKGGTCSGEVTVDLEQSELTLTPSNIRNPTCGANDGSFQVNVEGMKAPYGYILYKDVSGTWVKEEEGTLIAGNPTFVFLTAGTYKLAVSKGGTCSGEVTVDLEQSELTLTPSNIRHPSCGGSDGSFQVITGGIKAPYDYILYKDVSGTWVKQEEGTLIAGNPTFVFLTEGTYKVALSKGSTCAGEVTVYMQCEVIGREGCSHGYWKNETSAWATTNYSPNQTAESVFDIPDAYGLDNVTLLQALQFTGGSGNPGAVKILLRDAISALLNAAHPTVDYPVTLQQLITDVNTALGSGNRNNMLKLAAKLEKYNNLYCPLNSNGNNHTREIAPSIKSKFNLKAMPNPSSGVFNIQIESHSSEKLHIQVINMQGQIIEQRQNIQPNQLLQIGGNYIPGIYLLNVQQGVNRMQLKLVKTGN